MIQDLRYLIRRKEQVDNRINQVITEMIELLKTKSDQEVLIKSLKKLSNTNSEINQKLAELKLVLPEVFTDL